MKSPMGMQIFDESMMRYVQFAPQIHNDPVPPEMRIRINSNGDVATIVLDEEQIKALAKWLSKWVDS